MASRLPKDFGSWIAVWFGAGLSPVAPGTMGSLAALPLGGLILWVASPTGWIWLAVASVALLPVGVWAAAGYERAGGQHDSSAIVVDEVVGQWPAMIPIAWSVWWHYLLAFWLFRVLDVLKPWPIRWIDRNTGAWSVMLDDVMAGILAGGLTWFVIDWEIFG